MGVRKHQFWEMWVSEPNFLFNFASFWVSEQNVRVSENFRRKINVTGFSGNLISRIVGSIKFGGNLIWRILAKPPNPPNFLPAQFFSLNVVSYLFFVYFLSW
jgi:hypothetical protein